MATWQDYKKYVKGIDSENRLQMESIEMMTEVVNALIQQRKDLGITQRELAEICDMPQSSIARIETFRTSPTLDTLVKLFNKLKMQFVIKPA